jgi:hypothetical protein
MGVKKLCRLRKYFLVNGLEGKITVLNVFDDAARIVRFIQPSSEDSYRFVFDNRKVTGC